MATDEQKNPRLGDFQPPDRSARPPRTEASAALSPVAAEAPVPPAATQPDSQTAIPVSDAEAQANARLSLYEEMATGLTPVEDYQQFLKDSGVELDEAAQIVDDLFTKGFYEERVHLTKRIGAVLRTRSHGDTIRLQTALEVQRPMFQHSLQEVIARYNLAAALVSYGDTVFAFPQAAVDKKTVEDQFDTRLEFVERMPDPAFYKMSDLLARFDRKVAAVMREGVAENF